ncbi:MAG: hypothetical protein ACLQVI_10950 [Polyangiaceae bacterium]
MLARWGRLIVAFAAALAVWAIATPAHAAAPLCDQRGATGIAPPPQLQQPQTTIDVGTAPEDCSELLAMTTAFDNGRAPEPSPPSAAQDPVVPNGAPAIPPAAVSGCFVGEDSTVCVRAGARSRVDRPPRA